MLTGGWLDSHLIRSLEIQYSPICHLLSALFIIRENKINLSSSVLTTARDAHVQHRKKVSRNDSGSGESQFYLPSFLYRWLGLFCVFLLLFHVSRSTFFKAKLGFIYNFCGSKIDMTTSCYKPLTDEDGYFPWSPAFPYIQTGVPS